MQLRRRYLNNHDACRDCADPLGQHRRSIDGYEREVLDKLREKGYGGKPLGFPPFAINSACIKADQREVFIQAEPQQHKKILTLKPKSAIIKEQ